MIRYAAAELDAISELFDMSGRLPSLADFGATSSGHHAPRRPFPARTKAPRVPGCPCQPDALGGSAVRGLLTGPADPGPLGRHLISRARYALILAASALVNSARLPAPARLR